MIGTKGGRGPREIGSAMEDAAESLLSVKGYVTLERNYRTRCGEIDIVARQAGTLVFIEVRYRRPGSMVGPEESVSARKARRLRLAVRRYMAEHGIGDDVPVRVDLCVVRDGGQSLEVLPGVIEFA